VTDGSTTPTVTRLSIGSCTDVGAVRSRNEDSIFVEPLDSAEAAAYGWLGIVADGLGGHRRGDLASQLAVQTTREVFYGEQRSSSGDTARASPADSADRLRLAVERANATADRLRAAVERANDVIRRTGEASASSAEMASTITAAVIDGTHLTVAQVGDSRGYLIRNSRLRQITHDHSLVDELIRNGGLTPEQAAHHPNRNVITRALGTRATVQVDTFAEELHDDDVVVLCSDGLYRCVEESEIARALVSAPQTAAESLVALTIQRGAPDNVSLIIIRISISDRS
jgi:PPM family protein phosphatase